MRSLILFALFIVVVTLAALPVGVHAAWPPDDLLVCGARFDQAGVKIVSDGEGGSIVAWADQTNSAIYGQRLDGSGNPYWVYGGVLLSGSYGGDRVLAMVSDGAGGAIIIFGSLFAQRIDASGARLWGPDGIEVGGEMAYDLVAAADGAGGIVIAYNMFSTDELCAQKINSSGSLMWDAGPGYVLISDASTEERFSSIVADGYGGALIVFSSIRSGYPTIWVQRVFSSGSVWGMAEDGIPVGAGGSSACENPVITGDGTGGAIVAWQESLGMEDLIFVQRIDAGGTIQWYNYLGGGSDQNRGYPDILSDGAGGVYIGWMDYQPGGYRILAQRIDAYGNFLWTSLWHQEGVRVCQQDHEQARPVLLPCEAGVIVVWEDQYFGDRIMGQKLDIGGGQVWSQDGVQIIEGKVDFEEWEFEDYDFAADGAGGVLAAITDERLVNGQDIYAQSINTFGNPASPEPVIIDISDVPDDEGGYLRITIDRSDRDDVTQTLQQVANYNIWQSAPGLTASPSNEADGAGSQTGTILGSDDSRVLLTAPSAVNPGGTWEFIGSFYATQNDEYIFRGTTLVDSTASGNPYSYYIITAHTTDPSVWFISEWGSGYSVDNLAPEPPLGLASEQSYMPEGLELTWDQSMENDLWYYGLYRGTSDDFIPAPGNLIATPTGLEYLDGDWSWDVDYWYKISAIDIHGNESIFAVTGPGEITGDDPSPAPLATYLEQNYPNPFNPVTTIRFGLMEAGHVSLRIYDAAGRLVREMINGDIPAGHYNENWDGLSTDGSRAASGVYFYRLSTKSFAETRKMILLR
ncbi:MAG: T9SS type A sorting domain-containing protein [Candidatus Krumholzibacteria bacterium]|nr:T9SS type A sorting domain-containing protein [Candidatus Krumholzibacteria bacterium]